MSGSNRTKSNQNMHDHEVQRLAREYERKGYEVDAEISGYKRPRGIGGFRPDIIARKGGHETIVEVETPDSADKARDKQQQAAFQRIARRDAKTHYKRIITE